MVFGAKALEYRMGFPQAAEVIEYNIYLGENAHGTWAQRELSTLGRPW